VIRKLEIRWNWLGKWYLRRLGSSEDKFHSCPAVLARNSSSSSCRVVSTPWTCTPKNQLMSIGIRILEGDSANTRVMKMKPEQRHMWPWPLTFWPWKWCPGHCDVGYLCVNFSLPRPLCSRLRPARQIDRQTSGVRQHHRLMPPRGRWHNNGMKFACTFSHRNELLYSRQAAVSFLIHNDYIPMLKSLLYRP